MQHAIGEQTGNIYCSWANLGYLATLTSLMAALATVPAKLQLLSFYGWLN